MFDGSVRLTQTIDCFIVLEYQKQFELYTKKSYYNNMVFSIKGFGKWNYEDYHLIGSFFNLFKINLNRQAYM